MAEPEFDPKRALAYFIYYEESGMVYKGGGALLSSTCAMTKSILILETITGEFEITSLLVRTRFDRIDLESFENVHSVIKIIPEKKIKHLDRFTIALVIIDEQSENDNVLRPPELYIPLATRSYSPGEHKVTEFFIGWNEVRKLQLPKYLNNRNFSSFKYFQFI